MEISIFQIDLKRDKDRVAFESLDAMKQYQQQTEINAGIYDRVYKGEVEADNLEDVYRIFNTEKPDDYIGRSLSVSDVIKVTESDNVKQGYYYCDSFGFKSVPFDAEEAINVYRPDKIKVVMCEPGKTAYIATIGTKLADLQNAVGGYIESYSPFDENVCIVCNEEGRYNGMEPCRSINDEFNGNVIYGKFFICAVDDDAEFASLSKKQIDKYMEQFKEPDVFGYGGTVVQFVTLKTDKSAETDLEL